MHQRFRFAAAPLLLALFPFMTMAATPTPSSTSSGIEGIILVSPNRPGPIRKDVPSESPAGNVTFVVKQANANVASLTTDAEGRFRVTLPPGHYVVTRDDPGARIGHWHFEADVKAGEMTSVRWTGDSGMR
ncbi:MAG: hypothetical protein ACJ8NS_09975 [Chthoniobacterales bacterium]